MVGSGKMLLKN